MHLHKILAISRAERFSPNSVDKDAAILGSVCDELERRGYSVARVSETEQWSPSDDIAAYISMGRLGRTVDMLRRCEESGAVVVNGAGGVAVCCNRRQVTEAMVSASVPVAPAEGTHGYWAKRADGVAEGPGDVRFAADEAALAAVLAEMRARGVADVMVSAHVPGDLVKFYGVSGTGFFRAYYPGDDGQWKFDDERHNGTPCHYHFSMAALHAMADRAAVSTGVSVYGGDCIVRHDGSICIIDFNDWPSFSRCRDEAASAIAEMVDGKIEDMLKNKLSNDLY